ncbi:DNA repair and recombination protein RAD54B isoform X1 [Carcharodon carcharias]|uniref:DNA repair and recombination protein RAD54B isoform X1 n=2 Tax=Carcharodon carcharias TaxID=13397 RepID=UPI001B7E534C|nr:DNA repair and recombination protein RAD54B isoform X1 [Carcharodon carcharias]XP_041045855.1 DNA repair and recombination protein RAD54B isoform X1 [Carcharodon carcharias]
MRRSAAPSQLSGNAAKKFKFIPPGKTDNQEPVSGSTRLSQRIEVTHDCDNSQSPLLQSKAIVAKCELIQTCPSRQTTGNVGEDGEVERPESDHLTTISILTVGAPSTSQAGAFPQQQLKPFRPFIAPKQIYTPPPLVSQQQSSPEDHKDQNVPNSFIKYYSVLWCKASKKKHKKWEGDAILIVRKTSVVLKDIEGKDIGKGAGYKSKELETLSEGQTLMIGGKEIEILGPISAEDFMSGRCFHSAVTSSSRLSLATSSQQPLLKPYTNPLRNSTGFSQTEDVRKTNLDCKPRHDPSAPNALVMPRPNLSHQWIFNKAGLPLVDVVVDPYLTVHLRPHQWDGVIFLYECIMGMRTTGRFGAILADEMGLGKTLQCITLIWTLMRQGPYGNKPVIKKTLVITPGSLVKNWVSEFQKWLGTERLRVFAVDQDHKVEDFISSPLHSVLIISYEMLLRCLEQIQNIQFNLIICDEGHRLKNSSIKTSTAILSLSCDRRVILTGTPIQNDLQEFYSLIEFVNPGILGSSSTYRKIYEEPIIRSQQPSATKDEKQLGEERATELCRLTGLFILRRTQDIINNYLPPKTEWIIFCRPAALQLELYHKLLASHAVKSCLQGSLENSSHLICIGLLKKLCNHPTLFFNTIKGKENHCTRPDFDCRFEINPYDDLTGIFPINYESNAFTAKDSGKLQVLIDLLAGIHAHSSAERVVLISNYTQTLDILQEMCKCFGYSYTRLDGQTPVSHRQQIVDSFNSKQSKSFIFLLSSKAGGVGLNLIGASRLVLYDVDWNPANDVQAMARVWRDGQRKPVHIYRLLTTGTIEEKIYQRQVSKQSLSGTVVDLKKKNEHASFSLEELRNLFKLDEDSNCLTHDLLCCNCLGNGEPSANLATEKPLTPRACQLGHDAEKSDSQKHLSMSDLMYWKHFSGDIQHFPDPVLEKAKENITFIFQNITKPLTMSS